MTYTCALLEVGQSTFKDIKARIGRVNQHGDYDHMFHGTDKGQGIDMTHIMVIAERPAPSKVEFHTRRTLLERIEHLRDTDTFDPAEEQENYLFGVPIEEYTDEEALAVLPVLYRMYMKARAAE